MDKVLAFSIMSASPADISAGGAGAGVRWTRLSWRTGADGDQQQQQQRGKEKEKEKQRSCSHDGGSSSSKGGGAAPAFLPRFAPEFDGIDCFETIVSH
ncbi:hypothetical protein BS78_10G025200 [Paspalum vaginatum]|nr:hypothetical protein BS78_10G025200 [Paspalum vaginatum]